MGRRLDPEPGVALTIARDRARALQDVRYQLAFDIPSSDSQPIRGRVRVQVRVEQVSGPLILDFAGRLESIAVGGRPIDARAVNGHLIVDEGELTPGENTIEVAFASQDGPWNRQRDFLYTLLVPARAHQAFPCFDQPDLKARFTLTASIPDHWEAIANGREISRRTADGRLLIEHAETQPIPTYLFALAAGRFETETAERGGRTWRMLHREPDAAALARNREALFDFHAAAVAWLEDYTGVPEPFGKPEFVLIPSFQFSGMEHPGAIYYNAASLLLDASATEQQRLARAMLIAHEVSHLWFGDLVTMRWFDDVWLKEVFANLMAGKIVSQSGPRVGEHLRFVTTHYPAAYSVDRTSGTHPIRQPLDNLRDAGSLYGPIIYHKAPIVMRELERLVTPEGLRRGLRAYLSEFAFGNADWPDFARVLTGATGADIAGWGRRWIDRAGRPRVAARVDLEDIPYGDVVLPDSQRVDLLGSIESVDSAAGRAGAWIVLWEEMLQGRVDPRDLLATMLRALPREDEEQVVGLVLTYLRELFWRFLSLQTRASEASHVENLLRDGVARAAATTLKATYFTALRSVFVTTEAIESLERVWRREKPIAGLPLSDADETALALDLAVRMTGDAILEEQQRRLSSADRRARFAFVAEAASTDAGRRARFFAGLALAGNRRHEPWVADGLRCLNHPLRAEAALSHLRPALELLDEIQRTGDIFFPRNWTEAVLGGHSSTHAADIVRTFLIERPELPARLRNTVLQAADNLYRAAALQTGSEARR